MTLNELLYMIEGELPEGHTLLDSDVDVLIVTPTGVTLKPEQAAGDGETIVINARQVEL